MGKALETLRAMKRMREVYARKLEDTREQQRRLSALEHELASSLDYLDTCNDVCEPQRLLSACNCCESVTNPRHRNLSRTRQTGPHTRRVTARTAGRSR